MSPVEREIAARHILRHVLAAHEFTAARDVACFLSMPDEVDTYPVFARAWRAKKRIFAPVIDFRGKMFFRLVDPGTSLVRNDFGLWEPDVTTESIDPRRLDLVLTPLAAFDADINRIGMGGGYFDRCFAFLRHRHRWLRPKLMGIAFNSQRVAKIAANPWDIRLYGLATESGIVRR
jgi:5-formyltetrahydrofolate cyclo-ligase